MTTTARMIDNHLDGSPDQIEIVHVDGSTRVEIREHWTHFRSFAGQLLELIREAEASSDTEG